MGTDDRLAKEVTSDMKESEDRQKDLDRIRDSGADGADIRNAVSLSIPSLVVNYNLVPTITPFFISTKEAER